MKAVILNIGDELLIGDTVNTNASWMASSLDAMGFGVQYIKVISDREKDIIDSLKELSNDIGIVLITGGLGPTHDDITKHVLCEYFNDELIHNQDVHQDVEHLLSRFGKTMNPMNATQAMIPSKCEIVRNSKGTAPGMIFRENEKIYVSMPGVPHEMKTMMKNDILPKLEKISSGSVKLHVYLKTFGIAEATLAEELAQEISEMDDDVKLAFLPAPGKVKMRLTASGLDRPLLEKKLQKEKSKILAKLEDRVYGFSNDTLESVTGRMLLDGRYTISTAESCTGGRLASMITSIPGSSLYFTGSVVAYSNDIKIKELGVPESLIEKYGAVSEEVVVEMAKGIREKFNTDFGLATSGIAGPDGGSEEKPVGTVWLAVSFRDYITTKMIQLRFDRKTNIELSSEYSLHLLRKELIKKV